MFTRSGITARASMFKPTLLAQIEGYPGAMFATWGPVTGYLYQAVSGRLLILNPSDLGIVGQLAHADFNGTHQAEVNADETWAFVSAEQGNAVVSVNISDKANPTHGQKYAGLTANVLLAGLNMTKLDGTTLIGINWSRDSVAFMDVTNPTSMTWISEFRGTTLNQGRAVSLDKVNKICYYCCDATGGGTHRIGAIDYSNPAAPAELWFLSTADVDSARGIYWDADNDLIWVNSSGGSNADPLITFRGAVTTYQVNPSALTVAPTKIGQYKGFGSSFSVETAITATRSVAFVEKNDRRYGVVVAESPNNITILDVTDPTNLFKVGSVRDTTRLSAPMGVVIGPNDEYAYVSSLAPSGVVGRGVTKWDLHL